jgi:hypothetical protein
LGERGQFRRRQDGFNFHFASREGRDGGEGNLQSVWLLGFLFDNYRVGLLHRIFYGKDACHLKRQVR